MISEALSDLGVGAAAESLVLHGILQLWFAALPLLNVGYAPVIASVCIVLRTE